MNKVLTLWDYKMADGANTKATKIAQSDAWTALARVASVVGTAILIPIAGVVAWFSIQSYIAVTAHTGDIGTIKEDVHTIKGKVDGDHDWIVTLKSEVEGQGGILDQLTKLWSRPAQPQAKRQ